MKIRFLFLILVLTCLISFSRGATPAQQFLQSMYGAPGIDLDKLCWPNDDLWMLSGPKNEAQIDAVAQTKVAPRATDVFFEPIQTDLCIVEMRDGKIDASFNLESVHTVHRQLILNFIYACLKQDKEALARFATQPKNIKLTGVGKVGGGDLDQYQEIIASIPVVRSSAPAADKISKTVTYRLPLQGKAVTIQLTKEDGKWMVNTRTPLEIPLKFFFQ